MQLRKESIKRVLVTGGAGYIGSHVCFLLKKNNIEPICFDNFSSGHKWAVKYGPCVNGNILDKEKLQQTFTFYKPDAVIHMASLIQVGESTKNPLHYYKNNVAGTITLLEAMVQCSVNSLIFSSTAAVYGEPQYSPIDEKHPCNPINPYGYTKLTVEKIIEDCHRAYGLNAISLRYFNAAGACPQEGLREAHEPETHLIPLLVKAAKNKMPFVIYGDDYDTNDGTCIRDYIHVLDIGQAHIDALNYLQKNTGTFAVNLGSSTGTSVMEIIQRIEALFSLKVHYKIEPRRPGDPASLLGSSKKAKKLFNWTPRHSIDDILKHAWSTG